MDLAGQGKPSVLDTGCGELDDGGYLMVVLLIGIAVMAVWMGAMLPSWRQQAVREKEAELIFRGEQYARAIALYYRKNQRLPPNIDTLVSQRYLRKKYVDPMTGKEFLPLAAQAGLSSQQAVGRQAGPPPGSAGVIGVSGVRSTSTDTSIVVYRNQQSYSQFPFDYQQALQRMGVQNPQAAGPARGRGGRGGADELDPIVPGGGRGAARGGGPGGPPRGGGAGAGPPGGRGGAQPVGGIQTGRGR